MKSLMLAINFKHAIPLLDIAKNDGVDVSVLVDSIVSKHIEQHYDEVLRSEIRENFYCEQ